MKAVAAPLDHLAVDRGRIVVRLDQLDVHVTGKAHREGNIRPRGLPAIDGVDAREMLEDKPHTDPKRSGPLAQRRLQDGDKGGHLDTAIVWLTEPQQAHNAPPCPTSAR